MKRSVHNTKKGQRTIFLKGLADIKIIFSDKGFRKNAEIENAYSKIRKTLLSTNGNR